MELGSPAPSVGARHLWAEGERLMTPLVAGAGGGGQKRLLSTRRRRARQESSRAEASTTKDQIRRTEGGRGANGAGCLIDFLGVACYELTSPEARRTPGRLRWLGAGP